MSCQISLCKARLPWSGASNNSILPGPPEGYRPFAGSDYSGLGKFAADLFFLTDISEQTQQLLNADS